MSYKNMPPDKETLGFGQNALILQARANQEALWNFAVSVWQKPGCQEALITLQDHAAARVNPILAALWLASHHIAAPADLALAAAETEQWHQTYVKPLRDLKRTLGNEQALRTKLSEAELCAEYEEISTLQRALMNSKVVTQAPLLTQLTAEESAVKNIIAVLPDTCRRTEEKWIIQLVQAALNLADTATITQALAQEIGI